MRKLHFLILLTAIAFQASAQGTVEDYRRAYSLYEIFNASHVTGWAHDVQWQDSTHTFKYWTDTPRRRHPTPSSRQTVRPRLTLRDTMWCCTRQENHTRRKKCSVRTEPSASITPTKYYGHPTADIYSSASASLWRNAMPIMWRPRHTTSFSPFCINRNMPNPAMPSLSRHLSSSTHKLAKNV